MKSRVAYRVQKRRKSLRAAGLRPVQVWVPETKRRDFAKECHRQSQLIQHDLKEREILKWISLVSKEIFRHKKRSSR